MLGISRSGVHGEGDDELCHFLSIYCFDVLSSDPVTCLLLGSSLAETEEALRGFEVRFFDTPSPKTNFFLGNTPSLDTRFDELGSRIMPFVNLSLFAGLEPVVHTW